MERLTPQEIADLEQGDPLRMKAYENACMETTDTSSHIGKRFSCGVGLNDCAISPNGWLRPCPSLWHPDYIYDLKKGSLKEAWEVFVPRSLANGNIIPRVPVTCFTCKLRHICMWCPAHAFLESGQINVHVQVPYFCDVAHKRSALFKKK